MWRVKNCWKQVTYQMNPSSFWLSRIGYGTGAFNEAISYYAQLDNREIYELTGVSTYQRIGIAYASLGKFEVPLNFWKKLLSWNTMIRRSLS